MSKRISEARIQRLKDKKLRAKAKLMVLKEYPDLLKDENMKKKMFEAIDNANVAIRNGKLEIIYNDEKDDLTKLN